jgi:hypothetical protein
MVFKALLIVIVLAILMEDSTSIKKTEEERKEDEEIAAAVNRTLAEEAKEKEKEDEEKKRDEKKKKAQTQDKKEKEEIVKGKDKDEACPSLNCTCPEVQDCPPRECGPCAPCGPCPKEKVCPTVVCGPCPDVDLCKPCPPCPVANSTVNQPPTITCPEAGVASLSVPAALVVGVAAGVLVTGAATAIGLILRYIPPVASGFFFMATIIIIWYLCSQYPETARELGGRAANLLREAAVALGHRVMAAVQRHTEQVSVSVESNLFCIMSSKFLVKFALRFSM